MSEIAINQKAFAPARQAYISASQANQGPTAVVEAILRAYIGAAGEHIAGVAPVRRARSLSPCTSALAALGVGQSIILPNVDASNLTKYFQTARRVLGNPDAKWSARTLEDRTVRIRRNPDGFSGKDPTKNPIAVELAAISVGESILSAVAGPKCKGGSWQNAKLRARLIVNDPRADWSRLVTSKGLRITRIDPDLKAANGDNLRLPVEVHRVAHSVAIKHRITIDALIGQSRVKKFAEARHEFVGRVHDIPRKGGGHRYSDAEIGRFIDRDRTTVINSVKRWKAMCAEARRAA